MLTDDGIPQKLTLEQDTGSEPLALVVLIEAGLRLNRLDGIRTQPVPRQSGSAHFPS